MFAKIFFVTFLRLFLLTRGKSLNVDAYHDCGIKPEDTEFISGNLNDAGDWPWMASFGYYENKKWIHQCGATLISDRHFISAAHCIAASTSNWMIKIGTKDLDSSSDGLDLEIEKKVTHPSYESTAYFDIGIITTKAIIPNRKIRPVCLPDNFSRDPDKYKNHFMTIIGWGIPINKGKPSSALRRSDVRVFPQSFCNSVHQPYLEFSNLKEQISRLFESQLMCAGNTFGRAGSCKGDSGGPLLYFDTDTNATHKYVQVGMIQGSIGECGDRQIPGIYIKLDDPLILNFINSESTGLTNYEVFYYKNSLRQRYEGNTEHEEPWGNGTMTYTDGSRYEGEWFNGSRQGFGIFRYSKDDSDFRDKYEGSWENGEPSGLGTLTFTNGEKYEGGFKAGLRHGRGKWTVRQENMFTSYDGIYEDDAWTGKGFFYSEILTKQVISNIQNLTDLFVTLEKFSYGNSSEVGIIKISQLINYEGQSISNLTSVQKEILSTYEGEWYDYKYSGKGISSFKDGEKYDGEWLQDLRHGQGEQIYSDNDAANRSKYVGSWENNERSGFGKLMWKTGETYEGEWLNDLRHGKGKNIFSVENKLLSYDGDWFEDRLSGRGIMVWKNGKTYEGEWLNGTIHGKGKMMGTAEDVLLCYDGQWLEGNFSGQGVLIWKDGAKYEGYFTKGKRHGNGTLFYPSFSPLEKYIGEWQNGQPNGQGELYLKNGEKYSGQFKDWQLSGTDTKMSSSLKVLQEGNWKNDMFTD